MQVNKIPAIHKCWKNYQAQRLD